MQLTEQNGGFNRIYHLEICGVTVERRLNFVGWPISMGKCAGPVNLVL